MPVGGPVGGLILIFFSIGALIGKTVFGEDPTVIVSSGTFSTFGFLFILLWHDKKAKMRYKKEIEELKKVKDTHKYFFKEKLAVAETKEQKSIIGTGISLVAMLILLGLIMIFQTSTPAIILWLFFAACLGTAITSICSRYYHQQIEKIKAIIESD